MNKRILVIDDEKIVGRAISRILQSRGYEVEVSLSGEEGVKLAQEKDFQMALVDLVLPGIDGLQACRQLKECSPLMKLVLMSGYTEKLHEIKEAFASIESCPHFVEKPFGGDEILNITNDFFERGVGC
ncbi:MAG: response regulator [Candidatus Omnitrophota bacterium]